MIQDYSDFSDRNELFMKMEKWYDENRNFLVRESSPEPDIFNLVPKELQLFYNSVYCPAMSEIAPAIRKLIVKQYPSVKSEKRLKFVEYINQIADSAGKFLLLSSYELVEDHKEAINLREKYEDLDDWVELYGKPPAPPVADYNFADNNSLIKEFVSEKVIREIAKESWIEETGQYLLNESRRKEYFDIVQPLVLKYFNALENLDYEAQIVYTAIIHEDYKMYTDRCDHINTIISQNFDENEIDLEYHLFMEKLHVRIKEVMD